MYSTDLCGGHVSSIDFLCLSQVFQIVQNMAGEIFVHACHMLKRAETCVVASQNIYHWMKSLFPGSNF